LTTVKLPAAVGLEAAARAEAARAEEAIAECRVSTASEA
jgi:hypothetical protein